jgi:hypothetical protein
MNNNNELKTAETGDIVKVRTKNLTKKNQKRIVKIDVSDWSMRKFNQFMNKILK